MSANTDQRLVDHVRAEVPDDAGPGSGVFLVRFRTEFGVVAHEGEVGLDDVTEHAPLHDVTNGEEIAVPAPVLEHGELAVRVLREVKQRGRFGRIGREGLLDEHVLAVFECLSGVLVVRRSRRIDDHEFDRRVAEQFLQAVVACRPRMVLPDDLLRTFPAARKFETRVGV
jgi:hypothetical protein